MQLTEIINHYTEQAMKLKREQNMKQPTEQFNKPTIIAIIGYSNAGKTSIANYIRDNYKATKFTPIDKLKGFLEEINGLEEGELNTQEGKAKNPTGSEYSFGEILVNLFHFWNEHDSYFAAKMLMKDLMSFFDNGNKLCVVESLRNIEEVVTLNLVRQLCDVNVFVLNVMGKDEIQKTSDNQFEAIEQEILEIADETFQIFNSYNSTVYSYVNDIMAYLASEPEIEEDIVLVDYTNPDNFSFNHFPQRYVLTEQGSWNPMVKTQKDDLWYN